jgi:hypothetical protein
LRAPTSSNTAPKCTARKFHRSRLFGTETGSRELTDEQEQALRIDEERSRTFETISKADIIEFIRFEHPPDPVQRLVKVMGLLLGYPASLEAARRQVVRQGCRGGRAVASCSLPAMA